MLRAKYVLAMVSFIYQVIGLDTEDSFFTLKPADGSANREGRFPCSQTIVEPEYKEIILPKNFSCESCTVQIIWRNKTDIQYYCSDILIMNEYLNNCMELCENGGVCVNGACVCPNKYDGEFCEVYHMTEGNLLLKE